MPIFDLTCFPSEVHLHVKNQVPRGFLPSWRGLHTWAQDLKGNAHIAHFLQKSILPQSVAILSINFDCIPN
jgi:hypothetical protein